MTAQIKKIHQPALEISTSDRLYMERKLNWEFCLVSINDVPLAILRDHPILTLQEESGPSNPRCVVLVHHRKQEVFGVPDDTFIWGNRNQPVGGDKLYARFEAQLQLTRSRELLEQPDPDQAERMKKTSHLARPTKCL